MSPKRDSPVDSKEPTPKREPSVDNGVASVSNSDPFTASSLGIPPLPYSRRELFKVATNEVLDSSGNLKSDPQHDFVGSKNNDDSIGDRAEPRDDRPSDIIGKYANVTIRMISLNGGCAFSFPLAVRRVIDQKSGEFIKYEDFNSRIADMADAELVTRSLKAIFIRPETHYGSKLKLYVVMGEQDSGSAEEFLMNEENYNDLIISAYALYGKLVFKLHAPFNFMRGDSYSNTMPSTDRPSRYMKIESEAHEVSDPKAHHFNPNMKKSTKNVHTLNDDEFFRSNNLIRPEVTVDDMMARATGNTTPIQQGDKQDVPATSAKSDDFAMERHNLNHIARPKFGNNPAVNSRPYLQRNGLSSNSSPSPRSPIRIYDDDECAVRDASKVIPFAQESMSDRVEHLEMSASIPLPKVTDLPKLIKSHNLALKDNDDILSWYGRFNDFCMMLGIYICPANSMDKNSEMGKEWDSKCLPLAFYDKNVQSERILSHILRSPGFLPDTYKDELLLNPKPYNFLRLFIALHAYSASDLSSMIVRRPGAMKISQSLASYAYSWVRYFTNEANINGIPYSKYRQYAYFVDGLHSKFAPIKKFLEQDFQACHDRHNNIPISLELHNLPATIASLASTHGIPLTSQRGQIQQISYVDDGNVPNHSPTDDSEINEALLSIQQVHDTNIKQAAPRSKSSHVQCWLCDGPHTFRECDQLKRLHSVCAKRPTLSKYIANMTKKADNLNKKASIKAIIDLFDAIGHEKVCEPPGESPAVDDSIQAIVDTLGKVSTSSQDKTTGSHESLDSVQAISLPPTESDDYSTHDSHDDACYIDHKSLFYDLPEDTDDEFTTDVIRVVAENYDDVIYVGSSGDVLLPVQAASIASIPVDGLPNVKLDIRHRAQVDSAADRTTTPYRELIHDFRLPDPSKGDRTTIGDAGVHSHPIMGYGFFHIKAYSMETGEAVTLHAPCMYIPSIPSTLINFLDIPHCMITGELVDKRKNDAYRLVELQDSSGSILRYKVPLVCIHTRLYTADHLVPSSSSIQSVQYDLGGSIIQRIVSDEPTRLLWHGRFGHLNFRCLSSLHRAVVGLPKIKDSHITDNCPECLESKLRRSPHGHGSMIEKASSTGQIMSADWGFICLNSDNSSRIQRLRSYYGDTSYIIFTCAYSGALFGACGPSKAVPVEWLDTFFYRMSHNLHHLNKAVLVDRGSELGRSIEFTELAKKYKYHPLTCGPDKSSMNGLGERPHSTIGDAVRTMLYSAGLDLKFWNFAFHHFIRLYNMVPHGRRKLSPFEFIHGRKPDVSRLRIFGCRVYVRPPGRRPSKLDRHAVKGIFLGYTATMKQIYYLECGTNKVKIASHVRFDEGMNDLPLAQLPPFAIHIRRALGHVSSIEADEIGTPADLDVFMSDSLFPVTFSHSFRVLPSDITNENDTLGFVMSTPEDQGRPHITDIILRSTASQFPKWRSQLVGAFILNVNGTLVTSKDDVESALSSVLVQASGDHHAQVSITFAIDKSYRRESLHSMTNTALQADQLCRIAAVMIPKSPVYPPNPELLDSGESTQDLPVLDDFFVEHLDDLLSSPSLLPCAPGESIQQLTSNSPRLTRRILRGRPDWKAWHAAEHKQLDAHHAHKTFGQPMARPKICTALRAVWNYVIKWDGDKKARICCDGRPLALRGIKLVHAIYTACVSQTGMKLFIALSALLGYYIYDLDAVNAYAQGGKPYDDCYLIVDDPFRDWYRLRFGKTIPPGFVVPILCPLQGHPDAGEVWQTHVNSVLMSFGFKSTTHEPCLYRGTFRDHDILLCRQVDDMLLAGSNQAILRAFAAEIGKKLNVTIGDGPSTHYNGLDITQTREGIKIHCSTYLSKLAAAHGWDTTSSKPLEPIHPSAVKTLESTTGPPVDSAEGKRLMLKNGFNYRAMVGEIVYAYILCRPDFGFAVTLLSRFNTCPAQCHYDAVKRCMKSLLRSADEGIWYWRRSPLGDLSSASHVPRPLEDFELDFPILHDPFLASATVDASFGPNLLCRRSIGASFFYLGLVSLISYVGKLQPFTTDSSCAAEFVQYVHTGKRLKYVRSILTELGFAQNGPSPIYGDNMAAIIMMANNTRPTERTRHLDIRWFTIQEWIHVDCDIILLHIPGILNPSDAQSKALSYRLHHRHMSRAMGALGSPFLSGRFHLVSRDGTSIKALFLVLAP